jgi:hypothetical protein
MPDTGPVGADDTAGFMGLVVPAAPGITGTTGVPPGDMGAGILGSSKRTGVTLGAPDTVGGGTAGTTRESALVEDLEPSRFGEPGAPKPSGGVILGTPTGLDGTGEKFGTVGEGDMVGAAGKPAGTGTTTVVSGGLTGKIADPVVPVVPDPNPVGGGTAGSPDALVVLFPNPVGSGTGGRAVGDIPGIAGETGGEVVPIAGTPTPGGGNGTDGLNAPGGGGTTVGKLVAVGPAEPDEPAGGAVDTTATSRISPL